MQKIVVANPVVELDGDEMTRIIWKKIREEVRCVYLSLRLLPMRYSVYPYLPTTFTAETSVF
jgi:isocitrate dehydrogenase